MIGAIILGLVAGAIGKLLVPGKQGGGILLTIALGLVGSLVGYGIFRLIGIGDGDIFDLGGLVGAIIGTVIVIVAYGKLAGDGARR
jgi:uncharacterized membrane protein YeaQ/YmgE (transglycosylase-associated protein family)